MNVITLKSELLTIQIEDKGAQLSSVTNAAGQQFIWKGDPTIWGRHAPVLFPILGRLKDNWYTHKGETYHMNQHGFARDKVFRVVEQSDTHAVFRLTEDQDTLSRYPFLFALTITYVLEGDTIRKSFRVENTGSEEMVYELGIHDGFTIPLEEGEVMDDYAVQLNMTEMTPYGMDPTGMLTPKGPTFQLEGGRVAVKPMVAYDLDTVVLDDVPDRRAVLVDKHGRPRVTMEFAQFPYLGIWTTHKPFDTNYVCIEPWTTLPDATFVGRALADKQGVRTLAPGQAEDWSYTTKFE